MLDEKIKRSKTLQVRLTPKELKKIFRKFSHSPSPKPSDCVWKKLPDNPIAVSTRNQSLDDLMTEMIALQNELNAIGNNYNRVVKGCTVYSILKK